MCQTVHKQHYCIDSDRLPWYKMALVFVVCSMACGHHICKVFWDAHSDISEVLGFGIKCHIHSYTI